MLYVAMVYAQSAWHKLQNTSDVAYLFTHKLNGWAAIMGFAGAFDAHGPLNAQVVGNLEMLAAALVALGLLLKLQPVFCVLGIGLALLLSIGQLFFHLFTPMGIIVQYGPNGNDHGLQFGLASSVLLSSVWVLWSLRKKRAGWLYLLHRTHFKYAYGLIRVLKTAPQWRHQHGISHDPKSRKSLRH